MNDKEKSKYLMEKIKKWITDKKTNVRAMYKDSKTIDSFVKFIFASNHFDEAILVNNKQRRLYLIACSNQYIGKTEFFDNYVDNIFTQDYANHYFTYLMTNNNNMNIDLKIVKESVTFKEIIKAKTPYYKLWLRNHENFENLKNNRLQYRKDNNISKPFHGITANDLWNQMKYDLFGNNNIDYNQLGINNKDAFSKKLKLYLNEDTMVKSGKSYWNDHKCLKDDEYNDMN